MGGSNTPVRSAQFEGDALWVKSWREAGGERTIRRRAAANSAVKFYCSWFCPFAQRAWIALEEKGVNYRYIECDLYQADESLPGGYTKKAKSLEEKKEQYPDFMRASPHGLVPAMDNLGEMVNDSIPLMEYIDERWPDKNPLMPAGAHDRARVRMWMELVTSRVQKSYYVLLMEQDKSRHPQLVSKFLDECRALSNAMANIKEGPFFLGMEFSMMDIALAPFWQRILWVGSHYRGLKLPSDEFAFRRLYAWWEATRVRPGVAATLVCRERLVASYWQYSVNQGTSAYALSIQTALAKKETGSEADSNAVEGGMAKSLALVGLGAAVGVGVTKMVLASNRS